MYFQNTKACRDIGPVWSRNLNNRFIMITLSFKQTMYTVEKLKIAQEVWLNVF